MISELQNLITASNNSEPYNFRVKHQNMKYLSVSSGFSVLDFITGLYSERDKPKMWFNLNKDYRQKDTLTYFIESIISL